MSGNESENTFWEEAIKTPEAFLDEIYHRAINRYTFEEGATIVKTIEPIDVENWDFVTRNPKETPEPLTAKLINGAIIERDGLVKGFVLSDRIHSDFENRPARSFQFGITIADPGKDWDNMDTLRTLFSTHPLNSDSGEVYINNFSGRLSTNGADYRLYGGKLFKDWSIQSQLSPEGIEAVKDLIETTFDNSRAASFLRSERQRENQI